MMMRLNAFICVGLLFIAGTVAGADSKYIHISTTSGSDTNLQIVASNSTLVTATVILMKITGRNLRVPIDLPATNTIPPGESSVLVEVFQKKKDKSWSCNFQANSGFGDIKGRHDETYVYRLPYEAGTSHAVGQTYGGSVSHTGGLHYAVDFNMDMGTPVHCARAGIVAVTEESYSEGGTEEHFRGKANFVIIKHDDGTVGGYFHLEKDGVAVVMGDYAAAGQLLGYSGSTGWSSGPHLHFGVHSLLGVAGAGRSFPVIFDTKEGRIRVPEKRETYTARAD